MKKANKQRRKSLLEEVRIFEIVNLVVTLVATSLSLILVVMRVVLERTT